ncbi:MAG: AtpZ/AtpI family protein [Candidatus Marinimicrobia bacterium]|jgi:F0F1-type ATP synthase assembly protein I|nr:AtpZ/AtpI family protein [Candidatus Neomarinimicrobiota bacterium]
MAFNDDDHFLARSFEYFQKIVRQSGPAASASYTLIGAIILLGGIGYVLDIVYGWSPFGLLSGLILGIIVGFYELIKVIWKP